jgi:hypothetical protein
MHHYVLGWFLVTFSYLVTLFVRGNVWGLRIYARRTEVNTLW